jgi:undecaprenyl pyrophosphate phosphatase UppP
MSYISRRNFKPFGYYRIVLGVLVAVIFAALQ